MEVDNEKKKLKNCFRRFYRYITIQDDVFLWAMYCHISSYWLQNVWSQKMFTV